MKCVVVGGGIGGLTTAHYLRHLARVKSVVLLESSSRLGGWVQTTTEADGVRFEHGPRTVRPNGPQGANTLQLVEALGLQDEVVPISRSHPSAKNRLVLVNGRLHRLPSNLWSLFRRLPPFDKPFAMAAWKDLTTPAKKCSDDSIYDFVARRFGPDIARYAIDPMVRGICAGDARQISAAAFVAGSLFRMEQDHGGIARALLARAFSVSKATTTKNSESKNSSDLVKRAKKEKWSVWSLGSGLETLTKTLEEDLKAAGVEIRMETPVERLEQRGRSIVALTDDEEFVADEVFLTTPAFASSKIFRTKGENIISKTMSSIPFVTVAVVNVEFNRRVPNLDAFGFLVPSDQPQPILGTIFDTCSFAQGNRTIFTVMMGGAWFEELFGGQPDDDFIKKCAVDHLKQILQIDDTPSRVILKTQRNCIAQYTVGHLDRVERLRSELANRKMAVRLVGSSYDGVGINDVIMSARRAVEAVIN